MDKTHDCFSSARKAEEKGKKHKGLLIVKPNDKEAEQYVAKAKTNLRTCELFKEQRLDYKMQRLGGLLGLPNQFIEGK